MLKYLNPVAVAAHRGNSKYCPENTMAAFRSAVALEPDMLEIDLHMTQDGEIIMMHDHTVDRTTDGARWTRAAGRARSSREKRCPPLPSFSCSCGTILTCC